MKNKNVSAPTVSLPKAGGSDHGLGETFQADDFTGSCTFSIPLPISPCRGSQPHLALSYSSGSANGPFGSGFSLSLDTISRQTSKGIPAYDDTDTFIFSGLDYLVPIATDANQSKTVTEQAKNPQNDNKYDVTQFHPRVVGAFDIIEHWTPKKMGAEEQQNAEASSFWRVVDHENTIFVFGYTSKARISQPGKPSRISQWLLEYVIDRHGNAQNYTYIPEDTVNSKDDAGHGEDCNKYIKSIEYGNSKAINQLLDIGHLAAQFEAINSKQDWLFKVVFDYGEYSSQLNQNHAVTYLEEEPSQSNHLIFDSKTKPKDKWEARCDPFSTFGTGFEIRTRRLCQNILMFHQIAKLSAAPTLVHRMKLFYGKNPSVSLLKSIEFVGSRLHSEQSQNASSTEQSYDTLSLPPINLEYVNFDPKLKPEFTEMADVSGNALAELGNPAHCSVVDLYGEGVPGVLYSDGQTAYYRDPVLKKDKTDDSNAVVVPGARRRLNNTPINRLEADADHSLSDLNGNGRLDWVVTSKTQSGYYELGKDGKWSKFTPFKFVPTEYHHPDAHRVDVTGDGQPDLLILVNGLVHVYPNARADGFEQHLAPVQVPDNFPSSLRSSARTKTSFEAIDGSGTQHLVRVSNGKIEYWPNLGRGHFGSRIEITKAPKSFGPDFNPSRLFFADLTGSGTSDIVYFRSKEADIYFNHLGNSIDETPLTIKLPSAYDNLDQIKFSDLFGYGYQCLIFSQTHPTLVQWYCDFNLVKKSRQKPYLLNRIDNNQGAVTTIKYRSSAEYYLQDRDEKDKSKHWLTKLSHAVPVVDKIKHKDLLSQSNLTSNYHYRHGYYDGIEREFRGFGMVEHRDAEKQTSDMDLHSYVSPALTKAWYHTGYQHQNTLTKQYYHEYYSGEIPGELFPDSDGIESSDSDFREAQRALKGHILRTEIYGDDGSPKSEIPYSVTDTRYHIRKIPAKDHARYAVFYVHELETRHFDYERDPNDPRIHQSVILNVDDFGHVLQACEISYGRKKSRSDLASSDQRASKYERLQTASRATCALNSFILPPQNTNLSGFVLEQQNFGFTPSGSPESDGFFSPKQLKSQLKVSQGNESTLNPLPKQSNAELMAWHRHFYAGIENRSDITANSTETPMELPFGSLTLEALPSRLQSVVITPQHLEKLPGEFTTQLDKYSGLISTDKCYWNPGEITRYNGTDKFFTIESVAEPKRVLKKNGPKKSAVTSYLYDAHNLMPRQELDALNNKTTVDAFDYHTLHPQVVTDLNDNKSEVIFDPVGRVVATSHYGTEDGNSLGFAKKIVAQQIPSASIDKVLSDPTTYIGQAAAVYIYDDFRWMKSKKANREIELLAENYPDPASQPRKSILSNYVRVHVDYFDGFFRHIQRASKTEEAETVDYLSTTQTQKPSLTYKESSNERGQFIWHISGRALYDNKGTPYKGYQPYFADTSEIIPVRLLDGKIANAKNRPEYLGFSVHLHDPMGREFKSITPKGHLIEHDWTPWSDQHYDENDTFARSPYNLINKVVSAPNPPKSTPDWYQRYIDKNLSSSSRAALKSASVTSYGTPDTEVNDSMGQVILEQKLRRTLNNSDKSKPASLNTLHQHDIRGNLISSSDARLGPANVENAKSNYDLAGQQFYLESVDAGTSWSLHDVMGNLIYSEDSRGLKFYHEYDELNRPTDLRVYGGDGKKPIDAVVESTVYGDSDPKTDDATSKANNLRGKPSHHYDQSGIIEFHGYSLIGHMLSASLYVPTLFEDVIDWRKYDFHKIFETPHSRTIRYNAVGQIHTRIDPFGNTYSYKYYLGGALSGQGLSFSDERTGSAPTKLASEIKYDAHGHKVAEHLGPGIRASYEFDPSLGEPTRINTISSSNKLLQDLNYTYDPAGNVIEVRDYAFTEIVGKGSGGKGSSTYEYDSLYQLTRASGNVLKSRDLKKPFTLRQLNRGTLKRYDLSYQYDDGGNLMRVKDKDQIQSGDMYVSLKSNRAISQSLVDKHFDRPNSGAPEQLPKDGTFKNSDGKTTNIRHAYFDGNGNQIRSETLDYLRWNYHDNVQAIKFVNENISAGTETYSYNSIGIRSQKHTRFSNGSREVGSDTLYLGDLEIHIGPAGSFHMMRVGISDEHMLTIHREVDKNGHFVGRPEIVYSLHNNIGSVALELDENGEVLRYEEFKPFGETGVFASNETREKYPKRYRYSGKERDENSELYYYGQRYLSTVVRRWMSPDPAGTVDGLNLYAFVNNNPIGHSDHDGLAAQKNNAKKNKKNPNLHSQWIANKKKKLNSASVSDPYELEQERRKSITPPDDVAKFATSQANIGGKYGEAVYHVGTESVTYVLSKKKFREVFQSVDPNEKSTYLYAKAEARRKPILANRQLTVHHILAYTKLPNGQKPHKRASQKHVASHSQDYNLPKNKNGKTYNIAGSASMISPHLLSAHHTGSNSKGRGLRASRAVNPKDPNILIQHVDEAQSLAQGGRSLASSPPAPDNHHFLVGKINSAVFGGMDSALQKKYPAGTPIKHYYILFV